MSNQEEFIASIINSVERQAKIKERLAIMEILIEEIKHAQTAEELAALDRVAGQIKHRTTQGL
jgi:hypothetical protein